MFLNNPVASTRSILNNNENVNSTFHRSKSMGGENNNGTVIKKTTFNENNVKTPHRNKELGGNNNNNGGAGQTTQRRRRALGDISNRKGGGGNNKGGGAIAGGGNKGGVVVLKQQQKSVGNNSNVSSSSSKNRTSQVKFSKTPSSKSNTKSRLGGGINYGSGGLKSANSKPKQQQTTSSEYDGIFEATTRWADDVNIDEIDRSPYTLVPKDELDIIDNLRDEMSNRRKKVKDDNDRLEDERDEEEFMKCISAVHETNIKDIAKLGEEDDAPDVMEGDDDKVVEKEAWEFSLDDKLPWEIEDGDYDPAEERRLSGSDPFSMWGDI